MSRLTSRAVVEVAQARVPRGRVPAHLGVQVHLEVVGAAMGALEAVRVQALALARVQGVAVEVAVARRPRMQKASAI